MKSTILLAFAALSLTACGNDATDNTTTTTTTDTAALVNSNAAPTTTNTVDTYTPAEGDVVYRERKVLVMKNGQWVDADNDVTLDDGVVVRRNGTVVKDNNEVHLEEGEHVSRAGRFFDKTGNVLEHAWDKTKEGAKKAGNAVERAADKVGDKVHDATHDDDKNEKH